METKILTANPGDCPSRWELALRVELRLPCVSLEVACAHLQAANGMVVRVEHGPKGGWNSPVYFRREDFRIPPLYWRAKWTWYIVLRQLPRAAPRKQATSEPRLFL